MKYIGNGNAIVGVPARDLTPEEVEKFGEAFLLESGLYEREKEKPAKVYKKQQESDK